MLALVYFLQNSSSSACHAERVALSPARPPTETNIARGAGSRASEKIAVCQLYRRVRLEGVTAAFLLAVRCGGSATAKECALRLAEVLVKPGCCFPVTFLPFLAMAGYGRSGSGCRAGLCWPFCSLSQVAGASGRALGTVTMGFSSIARRCNATDCPKLCVIRRHLGTSAGTSSVIALPCRPILPVRPTRCVKRSLNSGSS